LRKLKRDSAKECRRAVFRVEKLTEPTQVFKVNMNAKQLALNGFVIKPSNEYSKFPTMVLVEGGIRAVKFYKNLMLKRINWSQNELNNSCKLIWEGEIEGSTAGKWRMHEVNDEVEGIRLLTEKKLEYFW
jgi:U4/U6 small nuclear ribonucleoprotein PRP3